VLAADVITLISKRSRGPKIVLGVAALALGAGALLASTYHRSESGPAAFVRAASPATPAATRAAEAPAPMPAPEAAPTAPAPAGPSLASASAADARAVTGKHHRPGRSHFRRGAHHAAASRRVTAH
jgi:hypothetical protein